MKSHKSLSDEEFERNFEDQSLHPTLFSHEAHLRLAYIHVSRYGLEKAIENVNNQILGYVQKWNARDKYNRTLTTAAVQAVNHFMDRAPGMAFDELIQKFPKLLNQFKYLMECHYSIDIFESDLAKTEYIEPDLLPFD